MVTVIAKITLASGEIIEIDRRNLKGIDIPLFDRSDLKKPNWGIISNAGSISYIDQDGKTLEYANTLKLVEGLPCDIYIVNTLTKRKELIGNLETAEWDYGNNDNLVTVSVKDDLEEWQQINIPELNYDPRVVQSKSFKEIYEYLWDYTDKRGTKNGNYTMLSFDELDDMTKTRVENLYIRYPLLKAGTLWQGWEKFCVATQCRIYKDSNGIIDFRFNRSN